MPDLLHLLLQPVNGKSLPNIMHSLKSYTAKKLMRVLPGLRKVWQDGYYEHSIRTERELVEKIRYVESNPLKSGLCRDPEKFCFSSASKREQMDTRT